MRRGHRRRDPEAGFSLVELMVVIFLIGLAATFIVLSAPPSKHRLESEAEAISHLLARAADEAMVSGLAHGALIDSNGVQVMRYNSGVWQPIPDAGISFSDDITLDELTVHSNAAEGAPSLWFDPTGMSNRARIDLTDGRETTSILIAGNSEVSIQRENGRAQ